MTEVRGKTVEEAIAKGLTELNLTKEKANIEIVQESSNGIFGIGSREAIVRISEKTEPEKVVETVATEIMDSDETYEKATEFLSTVLNGMGIKDAEFNKERRSNEVVISISTQEKGLVIGKRGQTLNALQYLVNIHTNREREDKIFYTIDIENYRAARENNLRELSNKLARKVKEAGRTIELEPMNSRERRVIHMELKNHPFVMTSSKGEEPYRKVVISPKNKKYKRKTNMLNEK
jgi:spoIIIJ-associated protein